MFHLMFVHNTLRSVWVAEWPPFGKKPPARLAICSHCLLSICNFDTSHFGYKGGIWLLIAPDPVHCFSITFRPFKSKENIHKKGRRCAVPKKPNQ